MRCQGWLGEENIHSSNITHISIDYAIFLSTCQWESLILGPSHLKFCEGAQPLALLMQSLWMPVFLVGTWINSFLITWSVSMLLERRKSKKLQKIWDHFFSYIITHLTSWILETIFVYPHISKQSHFYLTGHLQ